MTSAMTLARVRAGEPITVRNLTVIPLYSEQAQPQTYLTLDQALAAGVAESLEVSEAGSVPELRFLNRSDLPVLLLDGEELTGAKQNRVLNLTILAPPKTETLIPVSCIEAGRWSFKSRAFHSTERAQHARGRAMKLMSVSQSLKRGHARSDQGQVWDEIARKSHAMHAASPTSALSDVFDTYKEDMDVYANEANLPEDANGAAFAINGRVLGLEVFDRPATCARLIGKLIRSWSLDALERQEAGPVAVHDLRGDAEALAARVHAMPGERFKAAGMGEHIRFEDEEVAGGALTLDDQLIHSVVFVREIGGADGAERQFH